jgi:hypothetical protein
MPTELIRGTGGVLNVRTGEVLELATAPTADLADVREALTALDSERKIASRMVDEEIVRRTDEAYRTGELRAFTYDCGPWLVSVDTGAKRLYDSNALRKELLALASAGQLPITERAVEGLFVVRDYHLRLREWASMSRRWPELVEYGERHSHPARRYVRVTAKATPRHIDGTAEEVTAA